MISFKYNDIPDGKSKRSMQIELDEIGVSDLDASEINLDLEFNKSDVSVTISFEVSTVARFTCDRSLELYDQPLHGQYSVIFASKADRNSDQNEDKFKVITTEGERLDITKEVRDTLLLTVPIKKLHPRYLDDNGEPTDFSESYSDGFQTDPRWDALKELKDKQ